MPTCTNKASRELTNYMRTATHTHTHTHTCTHANTHKHTHIRLAAELKHAVSHRQTRRNPVKDLDFPTRSAIVYVIFYYSRDLPDPSGVISFMSKIVSGARLCDVFNSACTNFWNQEVLTSSSSDLEVPALRLGSPDSQSLVNQNFSIVLCHWKSNETS